MAPGGCGLGMREPNPEGAPGCTLRMSGRCTRVVVVGWGRGEGAGEAWRGTDRGTGAQGRGGGVQVHACAVYEWPPPTCCVVISSLTPAPLLS